MVSFRLSPEEYSRYRSVCPTIGARSISELARVAIERLTAASGSSAAIDTQVRALDQKVQMLSAEIERLSQIVEAPKAGGMNE